jgi:3-oxoacyl-[acyl-carrier protein] reductase
MAGSDEKTALVTGGGRGVGRAIVIALARRGVRVAFCYRNDEASAESCVRTVVEGGGHAPLAVRADITHDEERHRLVDTVHDELGGPDILVNNAGTTEDGVAFRMKDAWDRVVALDLTAAFRLTQLAIRRMMQAGWGRIVTIGSIASRLGCPGQVNYTAAKAGVEGMTRSLAQEYGRRGITVNTVSPGFVETDLTRDVGDLARNYVEHYSALGRCVTAESVASAVAFLVSDEAWAITGQTINVDGGLVKL